MPLFYVINNYHNTIFVIDATLYYDTRYAAVNNEYTFFDTPCCLCLPLCRRHATDYDVLAGNNVS